MITYRKTLFISDLHLEESRPDIAKQFLDFLNRCDTSIDALYILGDLFETWIGDDDDTLFHQSIIKALKSSTQKGLSIFFLHGNRDFMIGKKFLHKTGCKLLSEEEKILLYGTPVLLMHGDTLCTRDVEYLKWRKTSRHPILNTLLFSIWPLWFRRRFANKMRTKSAKHTKMTANEIMDVTQAEVDRVMLKHQVNYLIHGHTHKPHMHEFSINNNLAIRIVLGAWHECGNVLIWDESHKKEWIELR